MKILQVCHKTPYPLKDGGAIATHHIAKGLIQAGAHLDILAMNTSRYRVSEESAKNYLMNLGVGNIELVDTNTDISFTGGMKNLMFSSLPYNAVRFITKKFRDKLQEMLVSGQYDLVQFEGLYLMPYAATVKKYSNARIVLRAHNIEHEIWERNFKNQKGLFKRKYLKILARRMKEFEYRYMNKYDILVPITNRDALKFNEMGNHKPSYVCPFGFDFGMINHLDFQHDSKNIFYIGSLDWLPNQDGLVWFIKHIWQKIKEKHPEINFYVAGRNAPSWLVSLCSDQRIHYMGEVDDAFGFMESKAIMVVPLFSGSGMRVKIIEAMARGKVVITTTVGAEGIDIKSGEHLIIADDEREFISGIEKLFANQDMYLHIAKNAINFVKSGYNNKMIAAKLFEFYKSNLS